MNETIHIRQATGDDIPILAGIIRGSFRDVAEKFGLTPQNCPRHPSNYQEPWAEEEMQKGVVYYLLECESQPVGCVALNGTNPPACTLERLTVLPQSRRKGFGHSLVHHVFGEAKKQGFKDIKIGIIADYSELKDWYRRFGFTEKEIRTFPHLPFKVMFLTREL